MTLYSEATCTAVHQSCSLAVQCVVRQDYHAQLACVQQTWSRVTLTDLFSELLKMIIKQTIQAKHRTVGANIETFFLLCKKESGMKLLTLLIEGITLDDGSSLYCHTSESERGKCKKPCHFWPTVSLAIF